MQIQIYFPGFKFLSPFATPYQSLLHRVNPYPLDWKKHLTLETLKLICRLQFFFIASYTTRHPFSYLIRSCPFDWKENHFTLATLKLVSRLQFFDQILSRVMTPFHTLSYLIP